LRKRDLSLNKGFVVFGIVLACMVLVAGCSPGQQEEHQLSLEPTVPVNVEVQTDPETLKVGTPVQIMAKVTQGGEPVEDADKVLFELWREGQAEDQHQKMEGENRGQGIYAITYTFEEPGTYYVIPHTDARGMHTMPTATLTVNE